MNLLFPQGKETKREGRGTQKEEGREICDPQAEGGVAKEAEYSFQYGSAVESIGNQ